MAIFRNIQMTFWTDPKIADDFTPEDRYIYLYLMTNPHTNLCGCYELSIRQAADETGYTKAAIEKIIKQLAEVHKVIAYSADTREVLLFNWNKYNWTSSAKFMKPLMKEIESVKNSEFKAFLTDKVNGIDTVSIPYTYPIDTSCIDTTDTDTDTYINNKSIKHKYGEYKHISLTDKERDKLFTDYGETETLEAIKFFDEYKEMKGYKCKNDNLAMRKWVFDAVKKEKQRKGGANDRVLGTDTSRDEAEYERQVREQLKRIESGEFDNESLWE